MPLFVIDASATLPWCFEDESTAWTESLLERLKSGDRIIVPAHWPTEISNGLLSAERRQRIPIGKAELFWDSLTALPIDVQPAITSEKAKQVIALSRKHRLTIYDAAYLELSIRLALPLATLDNDLRRASEVEGVVLV
jgi:predicted nucleic acid-binding protein